MSMARWSVTNAVYRTTPTKEFPKGMRVRKATNSLAAPPGHIPVVRVNDGHMLWVKGELTKEG
jgi:hypothetical protein